MKNTIGYIRNSLSYYYPSNEIEGLILVIFNNIYTYSKYDLLSKQHLALPENDIISVREIVERLKQHEPIQYIFGYTIFYDLKFYVTPDVLIPRGETEEMVDMILKNNLIPSPSILDIGTGSGCIPISLKKNIPGAKVYGCDISEDALEIARKNSYSNNLEVSFFRCDILNESNKIEALDWDIIVSNPPYVTNREKNFMEKNVLEYEPHLALFVPDSDPLVFYNAISEIAYQKLKVGGNLYFEINEAYGNQVVVLVKDKGFSEVILHCDINGKNRMVSATK